MNIKKVQTWMMANCPLPKAIRWIKTHLTTLDK